MRKLWIAARLALTLTATFSAEQAFARKLSDAAVDELRIRREAASTVVYANVDEDTVAKAVLAAMRSIDPKHVQAETVGEKVLGLRRWTQYAIFSFPNGIDYYEATIHPEASGVSVTIRFDRESHAGLMGLTENSPHGYREGLEVFGSQGATLDDYALFQARVRYFLNEGAWAGCKRPKIEKAGPSFVCHAPSAPGNPSPPPREGNDAH